MARNSITETNLFQSPAENYTGGLHRRISLDLAKSFKRCALGDFGADASIRQGQKLAVVEVKTGDPELPLPSSTSAQMQLLASEARKDSEIRAAKEVLPVLVTNYRVTDADRKELEIDGIRIITVPDSSNYRTEDLFKQLNEVVGLVPDNI